MQKAYPGKAGTIPAGGGPNATREATPIDTTGETPIVNKYFFQGPEDVTAWHVYAVRWTPDAFVFLVDGHVAYRVTRPMIEHYGAWAFDTPKYLILNFALGGAYPFKTNGIETPYNGLPEETVQRIKAGEIAMYVDWVRVTRYVADQ